MAETTAAETGTDTEPDYLPVHIHVCRPCVERTPGECHAPGCFYWMHKIDEVPEHLDAYVAPPALTEVGMRLAWADWFQACVTDGDLTDGEKDGLRVAAKHLRDGRRITVGPDGTVGIDWEAL